MGFKSVKERREATYRLIVENSLKGLKTKAIDIFSNVDGYVWNSSRLCHDHCPQIWDDINYLNKEKDEIILVKDFTYWIGNAEETEEFIGKYFRYKVLPSLKRWHNMVKKYKKNGQTLLDFDSDYEAKVIRSFLD